MGMGKRSRRVERRRRVEGDELVLSDGGRLYMRMKKK